MTRWTTLVLVLALPALASAAPASATPMVRLAGIEALTTDLLQSHRGRVLVVNFWATWCGPCIAELPEFVRFHKEYGDRVDVVGISLDFTDEEAPEAVPAALVEFLDKKPLPYPVLVKDTTENEALINFYDSGWPGAIPATYIYDASGRQIFKHMGPLTFDALKREIP